MKRKAWAIAWKHSGRLVDLYGGLSVYSKKREAELDLGYGQKLVRVEIKEVKK